MAYAGKIAQIKVTGDSLSFIDESFSATNDKTYTIDDPAKEVWAPEAQITVYEDGVETTEDYTLNKLNGRIIFDSTDAGRGVITADGEYLPLSTVTQAFAYTYTLTGNNGDVSTFGDDFISREQTLKDASATLTKFTETDNYFFDKLNGGELLVIEFYYDENKPWDMRMWSLLPADEKSSTADGFVEDSVEFEGAHDSNGNVAAFNT